MSEAMFDKDSWNRAIGPALRALGYLAAGFLVVFILYFVLLQLGSVAGIQNVIVMIFAILGPITAVFYFLLVIFKVIDEELTNK